MGVHLVRSIDLEEFLFFVEFRDEFVETGDIVVKWRFDLIFLNQTSYLWAL